MMKTETLTAPVSSVPIRFTEMQLAAVANYVEDELLSEQTTGKDRAIAMAIRNKIRRAAEKLSRKYPARYPAQRIDRDGTVRTVMVSVPKD